MVSMNRRQMIFAALTGGVAMSFGKALGATGAENLVGMSSPNQPQLKLDDYQEILDYRVQFEREGFYRTSEIPQTMWSFEEVTSQLSLEVETIFNTFCLVNTEINIEVSKDYFVPAQQMLVVEKIDSSLPVFKRDGRNVITGLTANARAWPKILVSTGPGSPYIFTYSGIFRFNDRRMKSHLRTDPGAAMSYSSYLDFEYTTGREAGLAIHGNIYVEPLGKWRASHGCVQVTFEDARKVYKHLTSAQMWSDNLPKFDRRKRIPTFVRNSAGQIFAQPGIKGLLINFQGYKNPGTLT